MQTQNSAKAKRSNGAGFISYAGKRLLLAIILIVAIVGGAAYLLNQFNPTPAIQSAAGPGQPHDPVAGTVAGMEEPKATERRQGDAGSEEATTQNIQPSGLLTENNTTEPPTKDGAAIKASLPATAPSPPLTIVKEIPQAAQATEAHIADPGRHPESAQVEPQPNEPSAETAPHVPAAQPERHLSPAPGLQQEDTHGARQERAHRPIGVTFVEALIQPIDQELNQRFFGWRPNDIINLTDNTKNYQLGVLEVTRRTTVHLAERISRTGSAEAFNPHLQKAMNWFMVKADQYWFPAPETKYKESLKELEVYKKELIDGTATLYTRTDNLIPLLMAYENLLGSCDENLVKHKEKDGSKVSLFKADNYYYYAKGVASAIAVILEAIHHDFAKTLESRNGSELLHHAAASCNAAAALNPLFITDSDLDGLFANHRANMAAPISHARFYLSQLIKTLST